MVERMGELPEISVEKNVSFWSKKKDDRILFGLFFEEDILGGGKTQDHKPVYYLYIHKININLLLLEVWCVCTRVSLDM
jgi:hypothetical protein